MPRQRIPDFKCQQCPSIYLSQNGLDNHIEKEHGFKDANSDRVTGSAKGKDWKPTNSPRNKYTIFSCTMCNKKYLEQSGLDKHIEKDHKGTMEYSDEVTTSPMTIVMNRSADGPGSITSSNTPRRNTQEYKCQYCPQEKPCIYLTETGLARHVEKEHNKKQNKGEHDDWKPVDINEIFQRSSPGSVPMKLKDNVIVEKIAPKDYENTNLSNSTTSNDAMKSSKKKGKKEKDPNAPKRPLSAYFLFMADHREKVKLANPEFTITEIGKELGERWKTLDEVIKGKYQQAATKAKEKYDQEMKNYLSNQA